MMMPVVSANVEPVSRFWDALVLVEVIVFLHGVVDESIGRRGGDRRGIGVLDN